MDNSFLHRFLGGAGPSRELLVAFALGVVVIGFLSSLGYDWLVNPDEVEGDISRVLGVSFILTVVAYGLYRIDQHKRSKQVLFVEDDSLAPPYKGIIWVLGPGSLVTLMTVLNHHLRGQGAKHIWLVMDRSKGVRQRHEEVAQEIARRGVGTKLHPVYLDQLDAQSIYKSVTHQIKTEVEEVRLAPSEVAADVTGGLKPLTTGLVLAALTLNYPIEYVASKRRPDGQPMGELQVTKVDVGFYVEEANGT